MKKVEIIISAMFFLFFIISSTNFAIAENENVTISDLKDDVLVYDILDVNYNYTYTDEAPNIDLKEVTYIHNEGSKKATLILQVYGKIEDRGSLDEDDLGSIFSTVAYAVSLTTTNNVYNINYVNKTCVLMESEFSTKNITDWSVNVDKLTINIDLETEDETYIDLTAESTDIDIDINYESGRFYYDSIPNILIVEIEQDKDTQEVGKSIQFNANTEGQSGSSDDYSYNWDFGDGVKSTVKNPSHTYNSVGNYTVSLSVEDGLGNVGNDTTIITITEEATNGNGNGGENNQDDSASGLNLFITIIAVIIIIGILVLIFIIRR